MKTSICGLKKQSSMQQQCCCLIPNWLRRTLSRLGIAQANLALRSLLQSFLIFIRIRVFR